MTRGFILGAAALAVSASVGHAGPCARQIDLMQARIDVWLEAAAARGRAAPESLDARLHRQPTPRSIEAAEERLRELPPRTATAVNAAMTRAREADAAGDLPACQKALGEAQRLIGS